MENVKLVFDVELERKSGVNPIRCADLNLFLQKTVERNKKAMVGDVRGEKKRIQGDAERQDLDPGTRHDLDFGPIS